MFKSEDKKISEALTGSFKQEDMKFLERDASNIKWEFDKSGDITFTADLEANGKFTFTGTWEVKDKTLYIKATKVKSDEEDYNTREQDDIIENINKQFKSCEITSYDDKKIVFKDKEGEKQTLTKSKD
jgi:hypothetical protein